MLHAYANRGVPRRAAVLPRGHREAGQALGLSPDGPLAHRPAADLAGRPLGLGNLYLILLKDTALVSLITLDEIMRKAQVASNATTRNLHLYTTAAAIYPSLTVVTMVALHSNVAPAVVS